MTMDREDVGSAKPGSEGGAKPNPGIRLVLMCLLLLVPLIGPVLALAVPRRLHTRAHPIYVRLWGVFALLVQAALLGIAVRAERGLEHNKRWTAICHAHEVQLDVERWATDARGGVPATLDELMQLGYLNAMPINPYTGRPMRCIAWGDPPSPGEISYLPLFYARKTGVLEGYAIVVYGPKGWEGEDVDGDGSKDAVLVCLGTGWSLGYFDTDSDGVPDAKTCVHGPLVSAVLKAYQGQVPAGWTTVPPPNRVIPTCSGD